MTTLRTAIRQHIAAMPAYQPILPNDVLSQELGIPASSLIKLDANENPYGPVPALRQALADVDTLHIYPDPESRRIRKLLSDAHNVPEGMIVIGAGADELIDLIMRLVLEPGDKLLNCPPTFGMYAFDGALNQVSVVDVPRQPDFSLNVENIERAVDEFSPRMLFLANPNNPDGGMISDEDFARLIKLPLILVIDEAYVEFAEAGRSAISQVANRQNLIVLRTFSKWAGLAGLRIGYGVFPAEFVPTVMKAKQPYNVSVTAETAAVTTMQHLDDAQANIAKIIEQRDRLFAALNEITWLEPYPSQANFILCRVKDISALVVAQKLRAQGILIRYFDKPGLKDHIRISVGTSAEIDKLLIALKGMSEV